MQAAITSCPTGACACVLSLFEAAAAVRCRQGSQVLESAVWLAVACGAGDAGDVFMILVSLAVFIYLAMQLYRMYYYVYLQLGVMDMMS